MTKRHRASGDASQRPATSGRVKFSTAIDPAVLADIREAAKRKGARCCDILELAVQRFIQEDTAGRTDRVMAPLIDRTLETRVKALEGGLRTMIARLAHENLAINYILCNFIVEANIPPAKVDKWRKDGYRFAVQEFRRKPVYEDTMPNDDDT